MTTCDEMQAQLERHLRGLLDSADAAELEDHLQACEVCRSYRELAERMEDMMQIEDAATGLPATWEQLAACARRQRRHHLIELCLNAVFLSLFMAYQVWRGRLQPGLELCVTAALAIGIVSVFAWRRRALLRLDDRSLDELAAACREDLTTQLRHVRSAIAGSLVLSPLLLAIGLYQLLFGARKFFGLVLLLGACLLLALAGHGWLVRRKRLRRELQTLFPA